MGEASRAARAAEYDQRRATIALRERIATEGSAATLADLAAAEVTLARLEAARAAAETADADEPALLGAEMAGMTLGGESTRLVVAADVRMAQVPTSTYHLFAADADPLVSGTVQNAEAQGIRRVVVSSTIEGYSSTAVDTLEIKAGREAPFALLPTLYPERIAGLDEVTRATVEIRVEEIGGTGLELHRTQPIWLLPRTTATIAVRDPKTKQWRDLSRYLGAYVTPNDPDVLAFLRLAAARHPAGQLIGYQQNEAAVEPQLRAIFEALKQDAQIHYVNSVIAFSPEDGVATQRVRLPAESLRQRQANCIDGTVLVASLVEAASMNAALVLVPGHAFVAWETWTGSGKWRHLETTVIADLDFDAACARADQMAATYEAVRQQTGDENRFRRWPVRDLRAQHITPLQ